MSVSTFQIFKIIMGLIVGGFFLFFMLSFSGLYKNIQTESGTVSELKGLRSNIHSVYLSGTPVTISLQDELPAYSPPYLSKARGIAVQKSVPFFLRPGKKLVVYRGSLDTGPWSFPFVGMLPETDLIFNPLTYSDQAYSIIHNLTKLFPASDKPDVRFYFCNGTHQLKSSYGDDKTNFLWYVGLLKDSATDLGFEFCKQEFSGAIKIIISDQEFYPDNGFLIFPESGSSGKVLYKDYNQFSRQVENKSFMYNDPLDIFSILAGGEKGHEYKNSLMFRMLETAAKQDHERADLMGFKYSDPGHAKLECVQPYANLKESLSIFSEILEAGLDHNKASDMEIFKTILADVEEKYGELDMGGCS